MCALCSYLLSPVLENKTEVQGTELGFAWQRKGSNVLFPFPIHGPKQLRDIQGIPPKDKQTVSFMTDQKLVNMVQMCEHKGTANCNLKFSQTYPQVLLQELTASLHHREQPDVFRLQKGNIKKGSAGMEPHGPAPPLQSTNPMRSGLRHFLPSKEAKV